MDVLNIDVSNLKLENFVLMFYIPIYGYAIRIIAHALSIIHWAHVKSAQIIVTVQIHDKGLLTQRCKRCPIFETFTIKERMLQFSDECPTFRRNDRLRCQIC